MIPSTDRNNVLITFSTGVLLAIFGSVFLVLGAISWGLVDVSSASLVKESGRTQAVSEVMKIVGVTTTVIGTLMLLLGFSLCSVVPFMVNPKTCFNEPIPPSNLTHESYSVDRTQAPDCSTEAPIAGDLPRIIIHNNLTGIQQNPLQKEEPSFSKDMKHLVHFGTVANLENREPLKLSFQLSELTKSPIESTNCQPSIVDLTEPPTLADTMQPNSTIAADDAKVSAERLLSMGGGDTIFSQPVTSRTSDSERTRTPSDSCVPNQQDNLYSSNSTG
ncbi:hypothetical protein D915_000749 [Fasciola hepatica]|uniref:Uncharacterized protein n=1 Tax=Fasciola hepatica TaxID=6192 RepID=A0A4E0RZX2_FASHE|nr:hypothetical protein D915_000749 [Fasciola hepatica]